MIMIFAILYASVDDIGWLAGLHLLGGLTTETTSTRGFYGYSHEPAATAEKKSTAQLDADIASVLAKGDQT